MSHDTTLQPIPVTQLIFDPLNPRLPPHARDNDEDVFEFMLREGSVIELMQSIGAQDYFAGEPLLAVESKGRPGFYEVVEGNRRLCAAKLLLSPDKAPVRQKTVEEVAEAALHKPDELPVIVYPKREDILDYLGYRHITGIKQWDSLAKARYLEQLQKAHREKPAKEQYQILAKIIGSRADYVASLLTGLAVYDRIDDKGFFGIKSLKKDDIEFSLLTTALSYTNIVKFLGLESRSDPSLQGLEDDRLEELTRWVFDKNPRTNRSIVGESRNLRVLSDVVAEPRALAAFRSGKPLVEAVLLTQAPAESLSALIESSRSNLQSARDLMSSVTKVPNNAADTLDEIRTLARDLRTLIIVRNTEKDDEE